MPFKVCATVIKRRTYASHITRNNRCQRHMTGKSKRVKFNEALTGLSKNQVSIQISGADPKA